MKRALRTWLLFLLEKLSGDRASATRPVKMPGVRAPSLGAAGLQPGRGEFRAAGPVEAPDWLPEHRRGWCDFLSSPAGKILLQRAAAVHANFAIAACNDSVTTTHSAARAAGFGDALQWLESLSRSARANADAGPATEGQNQDTPPNGESVLRELMSP